MNYKLSKLVIRIDILSIWIYESMEINDWNWVFFFWKCFSKKM